MGFENGKLVRVVLRATATGGGDDVTVLHYDLEDSAIPGNDPNDPQSLADAFRDDVLPSYGALFDNTWSIQPVEVTQEKDPLNPTAPRGSWSAGVAFTGTRSVSSDKLPPEVCGLATLRTDHIGRRYRGRIFLPGTLVEADQNAGVWNVFPLTAWQTFLDAIPREPDIVTGTSESTAKWGVYSRTQRSQNRDPYISPVTSTVLRSRVHFLRSRGH